MCIGICKPILCPDNEQVEAKNINIPWLLIFAEWIIKDIVFLPRE